MFVLHQPTAFLSRYTKDLQSGVLMLETNNSIKNFSMLSVSLVNKRGHLLQHCTLDLNHNFGEGVCSTASAYLLPPGRALNKVSLDWFSSSDKFLFHFESKKKSKKDESSAEAKGPLFFVFSLLDKNCREWTARTQTFEILVRCKKASAECAQRSELLTIRNNFRYRFISAFRAGENVNPIEGLLYEQLTKDEILSIQSSEVLERSQPLEPTPRSGFEQIQSCKKSQRSEFERNSLSYATAEWDVSTEVFGSGYPSGSHDFSPASFKRRRVSSDSVGNATDESELDSNPDPLNECLVSSSSDFQEVAFLLSW